MYHVWKDLRKCINSSGFFLDTSFALPCSFVAFTDRCGNTQKAELEIFNGQKHFGRISISYKDRQDCVPNAIKCYKKVDSKDVNLKRKLYSFSVLTNCKSNRAHIPFTTQKIRTYAKCLKGQIAFEPQIGNWIYGSDKVVACYVKSPTENRSCILLYILLHRSSDCKLSGSYFPSIFSNQRKVNQERTINQSMALLASCNEQRPKVRPHQDGTTENLIQPRSTAALLYHCSV